VLVFILGNIILKSVAAFSFFAYFIVTFYIVMEFSLGTPIFTLRDLGIAQNTFREAQAYTTRGSAVLTTDKQSISKQNKAEETASWKCLIKISADTISLTGKGCSLFLEVNSRTAGHSSSLSTRHCHKTTEPYILQTANPSICPIIEWEKCNISTVDQKRSQHLLNLCAKKLTWLIEIPVKTRKGRN
jgi:hypothetical protein